MWPLKVVVFTCILIHSCTGDLSDSLHRYEIIDRVHIHSVTRRSTSTVPTKEVQLKAFGRTFILELKPNKNLFSPDFKIQAVRGDGSAEEVTGFDPTSFLEGHLIADPSSRATIHIDIDNRLTGVFTSEGEEFVIEPASRHVNQSVVDLNPSSMVIYRRSDIKDDATHSGMCGSIHPETAEFDEINFKSYVQDDKPKGKRRKRAIEPDRICTFYAVADYKFYQDNGESDELKTANYIANVMNRVNFIYKSTGFGSGTGYGFKFRMMTIHTSPSASSSSFLYNTQKTDWSTSGLLEAFSRSGRYSDLGLDMNDYCVSHLFTSQPFQDSVLGLAYIASPSTGSAGGICSGTRTVNTIAYKYNTAWTSSRNIANSPVLFTQLSLVTGHELAHNWGSEHDPDTSDCAPSSFFRDGKYIMYAYSVSGEDSNNDLFSSCSKNQMSAVIASKAGSCFIDSEEEVLCGNGRIDAGEECDGGFMGSIGRDPCCNQNCQLTQFSTCSQANKACCYECQMAPQTIRCKTEAAEFCTTDTFCTGNSFDCPPANNKTDGSSCIDSGTCVNGICESFCSYRGYPACACEDVASSCMRCCRSGPEGQCVAQDPITPLIVSDGTPCIQGYCQSGSCVKVVTDTIERLWDLIDKISFDFLVEAFRTNMVAFITCFSLIVYVPICIIIWCLDRRRKKKFEKENAFRIRTDRTLNKDEDKRPMTNDKPEVNSSRPASSLDGEYMQPVSRRPAGGNRILPLGVNPSSSLA